MVKYARWNLFLPLCEIRKILGFLTPVIFILWDKHITSETQGLLNSAFGSRTISDEHAFVGRVCVCVCVCICVIEGEGER